LLLAILIDGKDSGSKEYQQQMRLHI